jgi:hypothetical protein
LQPFVQSAAFCLLKRQCAGPSVFLLRLGKWLPSEDVPKTVVFERSLQTQRKSAKSPKRRMLQHATTTALG